MVINAAQIRSRKLQDNKYIKKVDIFCKGNGSVFLNFQLGSNLYDIREMEADNNCKIYRTRSERQKGNLITVNFDPFCGHNSKNSLEFSSYSSSTQITFDVALNIPGVNLVVNRFSLQAKCSFLDEYPVEVVFPAELETQDLGLFEANNEENTQNDQDNQTPTPKLSNNENNPIYPLPCAPNEILVANNWCISETSSENAPTTAWF